MIADFQQDVDTYRCTKSFGLKIGLRILGIQVVSLTVLFQLLLVILPNNQFYSILLQRFSKVWRFENPKTAL